jgi:hypothetical protein
MSFRGPVALDCPLAIQVAGPRNPFSAAAWPDAAARTSLAIATQPDKAGAGALEQPTGIPTVDFSVAPRVWGSREFGPALPRNDSLRRGAEMGLRSGPALRSHG